MQDTMIRFSNFTWKYESQVEPTLRGLTFDIKKGEKILICGPSGCGKSTIAHCLNGLIPFSYHGEMSGSLTICGKETRELSLFEISKMVGTVLQDADGQFVGLTVAEDIAFALENDCVPQDELIKKVHETAETVSILSHLEAAPNELSGGEQQRVAVARALMNNPELILADEPSGNLDTDNAKKLHQLFFDLRDQFHQTFIIVTHNEELASLSDRKIILQDGMVINN